ncbi:PadR family transcriptional regulator [Streptomyces sp. NPDC049887]|uniref:PadR family transcriptional regulator n=1 Tax=unclassified Streptomyces TaxID=2593676 RepID=UPI00341C4A80
MRSHGHGFGPGPGQGGCGPGHHGRGEYEGRRAAFGPFGPGFGGPPWGGGRGRGRGRARRGDVRASILALLKDRPMHGYEMIQEIGERSGGAWKPSPGSVYPTLQLLEDEGLITSESDGGKKLFTLTGTGRAEAESVPDAPWEEAGRGIDWDAMNEIRQAGFGLMEAFGQVWKTGTPDQRQKAISVIGEARKKLYLILADEG